MSFWNWIRQPQRFLKYDDAFALTRERLNQAINDSIQLQLAAGNTIVLTAHFGDTFSAVQNLLEQQNLAYTLLPQGLTPREFSDRCDGSTSQIWLALSASFSPEPHVRHVRRASPIVAAMVVERHPHPHADADIEQWFRQTGLPIQLGWFVSLSDTVVQAFVHRNLLDLMQQLGMEKNDLVSSHMLSRRLTTVLRRNESLRFDSPFATSCQDWLKIYLESN